MRLQPASWNICNLIVLIEKCSTFQWVLLVSILGQVCIIKSDKNTWTGRKASVYEGGHRVPFLTWWPLGIHLSLHGTNYGMYSLIRYRWINTEQLVWSPRVAPFQSENLGLIWLGRTENRAMWIRARVYWCFTIFGPIFFNKIFNTNLSLLLTTVNLLNL